MSIAAGTDNSSGPSSPTAARIEITPPKLLTAGAVVAINAFGLLLMVPVLVSMLAVSVMKFSALTFLLPLVTIAAALYFLPFGFGNPCVAKLARSLKPADRTSVLVQLTLTPRLCSGLRAFVEDADDIGWLSLTDSELAFNGDAIKLSIPFAQIRRLEPQSIGWRGFFLYNPRIALAVSGVPNLETLEFTERSSWSLPASGRIARELYEWLEGHVMREA